MKRHVENAGFSIIELMVSMLLVSIIMVGAYQVFQEGMQLFRVNQASSDAQLAIVRVMGKVASELSNASPQMLVHETASEGSPGSVSGVAFATPLGEGGQVHYDEFGRPYWKRFIAFYLHPHDTDWRLGKVMRAEELTVPSAGGGAPSPGTLDIAGLKTFLETNGVAYFSTSPQAKRRLVAEGISGFTIKEYEGDEFTDLGGGPEKLALDITIEAGDKHQAFRNSYFLRVQTRVEPGAI